MALTRKTKPRLPAEKIVIVCEGKVTEPAYFKSFKEIHRNPLVEVTTIGGCGVPPSVVQRAIEEKQRLIQIARRSRDSFDLLFQVWAVFDRDAHPQPQVPAALQMAKQNDIKVAFSNPCFEVWGLMHFLEYARPGHHHAVQHELKRLLPGYCHEKNPAIDARALQSSYHEAVQRSARSLEARAREQRPQGDPSTNVHELTEAIRAYRRQAA